MATIEERVARLRFDNSGFAQKAGETLKTLDQLSEKLRFKGADDGFKGITLAASKVDLSSLGGGVETVSTKISALGVLGTTALSKIADMVVDTGMKLVKHIANPLQQIWEGGKRRAFNIEEAKFKLDGLGVKGEELAKVWENVTAAVDGTAYSLDAAALTAAQMAASGMRGGEDMAMSLRAVSGVAAVTSSSYEDIGRIFSQIAGQGRLMGNDLLQLSTRGINAAATLAKAMNVTEAEIRDMVSEGEIDFLTFAKAMNEAFGDAAMKANETVTGVSANIRSAWSKIGADLVTPFITNQGTEGHVSNLVELLNKVRESINLIRPALKPLFDLIQKYGLGVIQGVTNFLDKFNKLTDPLAKKTKESTKQTATGMAQAAEATEKVDKALEDLAKTVVRGDWGNGEERIRRLTEAGHNYAETQGIVNEMVYGTYTGLKKTGQAFEEVTEVVEEAAGANIDFRQSLAQTAANLLEALVKPIEAVTTAFQKAFKVEDLVQVINVFSYALERLSEKFIISDQTAKAITDTFTVLFSTIRIVIKAALPVFDFLIDKVGLVLEIFGKLVQISATAIAAPFTEIVRIQEKLSQNQDVVNAVKSIIDSFGKFSESIKAVKQAVGDFFIAFGKGFGGPFGDFANWLVTLRDRAEDSLVNGIAKFLTFVAEKLAWLADLVSNFTSKSAPMIKQWGETAGKAIGDFYQNYVKPCIDAIGQFIGVIIKFAGSLGEKVMPVLKTAISWMGQFVQVIFDWVGRTLPVIKEWAVKVGSEISKWSSKCFGVVSKWFKDTMPGIIEWTKNTIKVLADWAVKITKVLSDTIGKWWNKAVPVIKQWFDNISQWTSDFFGTIKKFFTENDFDLSSIFSGEGSLTDSIKSFNIADTLRTIFEAIKSVVSDFADLHPQLTEFLVGCKDALVDFCKGIADGVSQIDGKKIKEVFWEIAAGALAIVSIRNLWLMGDVMKESKGVLKGLADLEKHFIKKDSKSKSQKFADFVDSLCTSILKLAGAIAALALLDTGKAWTAVAQIGTIIGSLMGVAMLFGGNKLSTKLFGDMSNLENGVKALNSMANALLKLTVPIVILGKLMNQKQLIQGLVAVGAALGELGIAVGLLTRFGGDKLQESADTIKALGSALTMLTIPIVVLGKLMSGQELIQGLSAVALGIGGLSLAVGLLSKYGGNNLKDCANTLKQFGVSLALMSIPIGLLGKMKFGSLCTGLFATGLALGELTLAIVALTKFCGERELKSVGKTMLNIAIALDLLTIPILIFAKVPFQETAVGLAVVGGALVALSASIMLISHAGVGGMKGALGIVAVAGGLLLLAGAVQKLCELSWSELAVSLVGLGGSLAVVVIAGYAAEGAALGLLALGAACLMIAGSVYIAAAAFKLIVETLQLIADETPESCRRIVQNIDAFADELSKSAYNIGKNFVASIVSGFIGGIVGIGKGIWDAGAGFVNDVKNLFSGKSDEGKEYEKAGEQAAKYVGEGIKKGSPQALRDGLEGSSISWDATFLGEKAGTEVNDGMSKELSAADNTEAIESAVTSEEGASAGAETNAASFTDTMKEKLAEFGLSDEEIEQMTGNLNMGDMGNLAGDGFMSSFTSMLNSEDGGLGSVAENIDFSSLTGAFSENGTSAMDAFAGAMTENKTPVEQAAQQAVDVVPETLASNDGKVKTSGENTMKAYGEGIKNGYENSARPAIQNSKAVMLLDLDAGKVEVQSKGEQYADSFATGLRTGLETSVDPAVSTMVAGIQTAIENRGPSFEIAGGNSGRHYADGIKACATDLETSGTTIADSVIRGIKAIDTNLNTAGKESGKTYSDGIQNGIDSERKNVESSLNDTVKVFSDKVKAFEDLGTTSGKEYTSCLNDDLKRGLDTVKGTITQTINDILVTTLRAINNSSNEFQNAGQNIMTSFSNGIQSGLNNLYNAITRVSDNIVNYFNRERDFYILGSNCMVGFANGMMSQSRDVYRIAEVIAQNALTAAKRAVDSHSPSRKFYELGVNNDKGLILGMEALAGDVESASSDVAKAGLKTMQDSLDGLDMNRHYTTTFTVALDNDLLGVESFISALKTRIEELVTTSNAGMFHTYGASIMDNLVTGMEDGFNNTLAPALKKLLGGDQNSLLSLFKASYDSESGGTAEDQWSSIGSYYMEHLAEGFKTGYEKYVLPTIKEILGANSYNPYDESGEYHFSEDAFDKYGGKYVKENSLATIFFKSRMTDATITNQAGPYGLQYWDEEDAGDQYYMIGDWYMQELGKGLRDGYLEYVGSTASEIATELPLRVAGATKGKRSSVGDALAEGIGDRLDAWMSEISRREVKGLGYRNVAQQIYDLWGFIPPATDSGHPGYIRDGVNTYAGKTVYGVTALGADFANGAYAAGGNIKKGTSYLSDALKRTSSAIGTGTSNVANSIYQGSDGMGTAFEEVDGTFTTSTNDIYQGSDGLGMAFEEVDGAVTSGIGNLTNSIYRGNDGLGTAFEELNSTISNGMNGLKYQGLGDLPGTPFEEVTKTATSTVARAVDDIYQGWDGTGTPFEEVGEDMMIGLQQGMESRFEELNDTGDASTSYVLEAAKAAVDSHSPSKKFFTLGQDNVRGLILGMQSLIQNAIDSADEVSQTVLSRFKQRFSEFNFDDLDDISHPVITPVVDLSNVSIARDDIGSMLSLNPETSMQFKTHLNDKNFQNEAPRIEVDVNNESLVQSFEDLKSEVASLKGTMANLKVYLDGHTLVGGIIDEVDTKLGKGVRRRSKTWE